MYLSHPLQINDYFDSRRNEIAAYQNLVIAAKAYIATKDSSIKVGCIFAYHDAVSNNVTDIIESFVPLSDVVFYTFYLYSNGFIFNKDPL